jgi:hypothetical protein
VWLAASSNDFVATRIDVIGEAAVVPPPPAAPVEEVSADPLPIAGIVLGTIFVAGLVYLLTRDYDGRFYRYPYYGSYYRHYYRPEYRPYFGGYPGLPPIITPAPVLAGLVLGTAVVGGSEFLVARDRDGRFYRYPYYGPYRAHYYRPEYRPYNGPYREAPVRQVDPRWELPAYRNGHNAPGNYNPNWNGPRRDAPVQQVAPQRWTPPANQNAPANYRQNWNAPANQGGPRRDAPAYRQPSQGCQGGSNQPCGGRDPGNTNH